MNRDFHAISPSAKALLLLKGITTIPFARETAELISLPGRYQPELDNKDVAFWKRVVHFENRYWSVDQLLADVGIDNIFEISSGYSMRSLEMVRRKNVYYLDTDLPEMVQHKSRLIETLKANNKIETKGRLLLQPLNALDSRQFETVTAAIPEGPVVVVNEGLLMYLDEAEKRMLLKYILALLKERGGYWITGDIYVRTSLERLQSGNDALKDLTDQQHIEEKMFDSFEHAEKFFRQSGFRIDKVAETDLSKLSSLQYMVNNITPEQLTNLQSAPRFHATWRLVPL